MKHLLSTFLAFAAIGSANAAQPDSVYLRLTNPAPVEGLRASWSVDNRTWMNIGENHNLLKSDYGSWGSQKKMYSPSCIFDGGRCYVVFSVNDKVNQFATTWSDDLFVWKPQDYPYLSTTQENCLNPVLTKQGNLFVVTYQTSNGNTYRVTSTDFKQWSKAEKITAAPLAATTMMRVPYTIVDNLSAKVLARQMRGQKEGENTRDDAQRFGRVTGIDLTVAVDLQTKKAISPDLFGIFFEDINYAADGGLYAELIQNRDFEYTEKDHQGWNARTAWRMEGTGTTFDIATDNPLHANNSHYALLRTTAVGAQFINEGFDGIALKAKAKYNLSLFLKGKGKAKVSLVSEGKTLATTTVSATAEWRQQQVMLTPSADAKAAQLVIEPQQAGDLSLDFVSLFPQDTYKNRPNGMRRDLAECLEAMHPRFIRFPGGCASHGQGIDNIYQWQHTIGKLWERQSDFNIWRYHQSRGLGFYEYFQLCEDLGAEPLPVLAAGVPCQNSWLGGNGQMGGLPWARDAKPGQLTMEAYLQSLLDLIEWANGDPKTSSWARQRAEAGHPKPFNMKYLGIGNEDLISDVFLERYNYLVSNIKKAHPEIKVVGTVGPFYEGSDYEFGWRDARETNKDIVDEHYYNGVGWYLNNQDFYDRYDRNGTKVYLGEWASRGNRLENALAEALHITNVERNADVVVMSSYAPLFAKEGHTQWNPDLIYFNNNEVKPTCNYYVQQLSGANSGDEYIYSDLALDYSVSGDNKNFPLQDLRKRVNVSVVRDTASGDIILKFVNILPVEAKVNVKGIATTATDKKGKTIDLRATASTLTGKPQESWQKPTVSEGTATDILSQSLPPYSFRVVRVKK